LVAIGVIASKAWHERSLARRSAESEAGQNHIAAADPAPDDGIDIEEHIALAVRQARLRQSYEFLAGDPALEEYRERAERYLVERFGSQQN
jgi:hypothetical protein